MNNPTVGLPYLTADLPGTGGTLRQTPADFVVVETPLYPASGNGDHLHVSLTREGMTTPHVREMLAGLFQLSPQQIGYAGLKDRQARVTQLFSLPDLEPDDAQRIDAELEGIQVNWARKHRNKLKTGHLLGNQFTITIRNVGADALMRCQAITARLQTAGVPNYFGPQRFGNAGDNASRGREALLGHGPRDRWLRRFLISAFQSLLFNRYLALRLQRELFGRLLLGDIAKKEDTGGLFSVADPEQEQARYLRGEIHCTGPLFGSKMWDATGPAGALEAELWAESGVTRGDFARQRIAGTRRPGRVWVPEIHVQPVAEDALALHFFLRKGAFATSLLREVMKDDLAAR